MVLEVDEEVLMVEGIHQLDVSQSMPRNMLMSVGSQVSSSCMSIPRSWSLGLRVVIWVNLVDRMTRRFHVGMGMVMVMNGMMVIVIGLMGFAVDGLGYLTWMMVQVM